MIVNKELAVSNGCLQKDLWETPENIFKPLHYEFNFTLDPCCEYHTAKCERFFTPVENGLIQDWSGNVVFCNPPYSRGNIDLWVEKCYNESQKDNTVIVALVPVSTSAKWFHQYVLGKAEIRFIQGRIRFVGAPFTAPFSSMILIYRNERTPEA